MKIFYLILIIRLSTVGFDMIYSQQPTQEWVARYPDINNGSAAGHSIAVDNLGNVYVTGVREESGSLKFCTIKYNAAGVQEWLRLYDNIWGGGNQGKCVIIDKSKNIYAAGYTYGGSEYFNYCIIKYTKDGIQQWIRIYNGPGNGIDQITHISVDSMDNIIVTGISSRIGEFNYDYATIKYDSAGNELWVRRYGVGSSSSFTSGIAVDIDQNSYVTGSIEGNCVTVKYSPSGQILWTNTYDSGNVELSHSLTIDNIGNVIITGENRIAGGQDFNDYLTIKYSSLGVLQWVRKYDGNAHLSDVANSVTSDHNGNVYVGGTSYVTNSSSEFCTIKYSHTGNQQWIRNYGSPSNLYSNVSMSLNRDGSLYIGGWQATGLGADYVLIKYSINGMQFWVTTYNGSANRSDYLYALTTDNTGNVYVTGQSERKDLHVDCCTIKYSQNIGIQIVSNDIPRELKLGQCYPNPFNPVCKIKFSIPSGKKRHINITLYNSLGQRITCLVNEVLKAGTYETEWNGKDYSSGIYYYVMKAESFLTTKKMILLK
ncbi:MAG: SBBP repeat-containing protein [Ignavibacteria bacterium]|nr:SBBP repeat-containing protein [Ignavibacteria bacterium]